MWGNEIKLPDNFIFTEQYLAPTVSTLAKFSSFHGDKIKIDFSEVKKIGKGDLMVLMAQIEKNIFNKGKKITFIGKMPQIVKQLFKEKAHHFVITKENFNKYEVAEKTNQVNPIIISKNVVALEQVGIKKNSSDGLGFYERIEAFLSEIIGNAVEHGIKENNLNYWLCYEKIKNTIKFTFVDMGIGIAHSHKKARLLLGYRLMGKYGENKIILDSLYKKLPSSTKLEGRGRGLPEIREMIEKEWVSDFLLVTNKSAVRYIDNQFKVSNNKNFKGTYYSWTINKNNFEKWKSTKLK
jgi:hypothetical protein